MFNYSCANNISSFFFAHIRTNLSRCREKNRDIMRNKYNRVRTKCVINISSMLRMKCIYAIDRGATFSSLYVCILIIPAHATCSTVPHKRKLSPCFELFAYNGCHGLKVTQSWRGEGEMNESTAEPWKANCGNMKYSRSMENLHSTV